MTLLLEPMPARPTVAIFGMGHVGYELARILSRLELRLELVDSREDQLDPLRLAEITDGAADVTAHHLLLGEQVLERLPRGAHVLIMSHDHAEDFALCDAALRLPQLGSIGLIGSSREVVRLPPAAGRSRPPAETIDRIRCPIGLPEITGKQPAVIAVVRGRLAAAADAARHHHHRSADRLEPILADYRPRPRSVGCRRDPVPRPPSSTPPATRSPATRPTRWPPNPTADCWSGTASSPPAARSPALRAEHPDEPVAELTGGLLLPGFVDTHVHYPQIRAIGGLGMPLLDWLEQVRAARGEQARRPGLRRAAWRRSSSDGLLPAGPPRRWCSARTSNRRWTSCSPPPGRRAEHHHRTGALRPDPAGGPALLPGRRAGRLRAS